MEKEFNLSEKIIKNCWIEDIDKNGKRTMKADELFQDETIQTKDVKEFIRLLKEEFDRFSGEKAITKDFTVIIDKLAGDDLTDCKED